MAVSDRWNRVPQRPHTRTIPSDNDSEPQKVIEGGAYDPGLPLSTATGRNVRTYRRTIARQRFAAPVVPAPVPAVTSQAGTVTGRAGQDGTGPVSRQNPQDSSMKPPVTSPGPGVNRSRREPATGAHGPSPEPGPRVTEALEAIKIAHKVRYCEGPNCGAIIPDDAFMLRVTCSDRCRQAKSRLERRQRGMRI